MRKITNWLGFIIVLGLLAYGVANAAGIKDYSTTAASNTALFPEGMAPSAVNDSARQVQADLRQWYNDAQWVIYGDGDGSFTAAYASATSFTISGANVTSAYEVGRRIKAVGTSTGTIYGTIASSSFSTNTTVTVTWDSGSLSNESLTIYLGILTNTNHALPSAVVQTSTANSFTGDQTFSTTGTTATSPIEIISTDTGASAGPNVSLYRNSSGSAAASDIMGTIHFNGRDSANNKQEYANIEATITDPTSTSEDSTLLAQTVVAGTLATRATIGQGLQIGSPTGGDQGAGTVNATQFYDDGAALPASVASQADMETATSLTAAVPAGRVKNNPGVSKAWAYVTVSGGTPTLAANYNVTSITDSGVGTFVVNFTTAFSSASYVCTTSTTQAAGANRWIGRNGGVSPTASAFPVLITNSAGSAVDPAEFSVACFGDQ